MTGLFVHIEFQRVQTFLFAVPRLRAMLGANAALGEVLRIELPQRIQEIRRVRRYDIPAAGFPAGDLQDDPLNNAARTALQRDCPATLWNEYGINSRDGGHFEAWFPDTERADAFIESARHILAAKLPGLAVRISCAGNELPRRPPVGLATLPVLQVCQLTGTRPANCILHKDKVVPIGTPAPPSKPDMDDRYCASQVGQLLKKGEAFRKNHPQVGNGQGTEDIIGCLYRQLPCVELEAPNNLEQLCAGGYLALIHADGNGVGDLSGRVSDAPDNTPAGKAAREDFFYGLRHANRRAVVGALKQTFKDFDGKLQPYQLLMLGGDDLMMICQARFALPFLHHYAETLQACQPATLPQGAALTFAAGVVISRPGVPVHQLHRLVEELGDSAKRLARSLAGRRSTVDWLVHSDSWADDPIARRRQIHCRDDGEWLRVTCGKPYPILSDAECPATEHDSLAALLEYAAQLRKDVDSGLIARSQLQRLDDALRAGRYQAELALAEAPEALQTRLSGFLNGTIWQALNSEGHARVLFSGLSDLIEVFEIELLGRKAPNQAASTEPVNEQAIEPARN